jgi:hypothetical protein
MDDRSRKSLIAALGTDLPPNFSPIHPYGEFVNWDDPEESRRGSVRVIRVVGKGRHLVLFAYDQDDARLSRPTSRLLYLNEHQDLVVLDAKAIMAEAQAATRKGTYLAWDRVIGEWLAAHGARTFKGRNWAASCARNIHGLVRRWQSHYTTSLKGM